MEASFTVKHFLAFTFWDAAKISLRRRLFTIFWRVHCAAAVAAVAAAAAEEEASLSSTQKTSIYVGEIFFHAFLNLLTSKG